MRRIDAGSHEVGRTRHRRYNEHAMSLRNIDIASAMRRIADRLIEDAMKEGKFDNLAGAGKPLELEPIPAEENARATWWAVRLLKKTGNSDLAVKLSKTPDVLR